MEVKMKMELTKNQNWIPNDLKSNMSPHFNSKPRDGKCGSDGEPKKFTTAFENLFEPKRFQTVLVLNKVLVTLGSETESAKCRAI
jgi:uncharacterized MAPEG superfamily protein